MLSFHSPTDLFTLSGVFLTTLSRSQRRLSRHHSTAARSRTPPLCISYVRRLADVCRSVCLSVCLVVFLSYCLHTPFTRSLPHWSAGRLWCAVVCGSVDGWMAGWLIDRQTNIPRVSCLLMCCYKGPLPPMRTKLSIPYIHPCHVCVRVYVRGIDQRVHCPD